MLFNLKDCSSWYGVSIRILLPLRCCFPQKIALVRAVCRLRRCLVEESASLRGWFISERVTFYLDFFSWCLLFADVWYCSVPGESIEWADHPSRHRTFRRIKPGETTIEQWEENAYRATHQVGLIVFLVLSRSLFLWLYFGARICEYEPIGLWVYASIYPSS